MGNVQVVCGGIDDRQADYEYESDAARHVHPDLAEDSCEVRFCGFVPSALSRYHQPGSIRPTLRALKYTLKGPPPDWRLKVGNPGAFESDFELQELIDVGSFGQVYVAVSHSTQQRSAVKIFRIDPTKPKPPKLGTEEDLDDNLVAAIAYEELMEGEDLDATLSSVLDKAVAEEDGGEGEGERSRSSSADTRRLSDAGTSVGSSLGTAEAEAAAAAEAAVEEAKHVEDQASPESSASGHEAPSAPSPASATLEASAAAATGSEEVSVPVTGEEEVAPAESAAAKAAPSLATDPPKSKSAAKGAIQHEGKEQHEPSIEQLQDVYHEIGLLQQLEHVNIVRYIDFYESDDRVYLITELVQGGKLFDSICAKGKYPEADARQVISGVLHALEYLHDLRIIYRDLKPENVLLVGDESPNQVKLCDFGFATQLRDSNYATGKWYTPGFGAPELLSGMPYDFKVDVYSLGVLSFVLLTGCIPWDEEIWMDEAKIDEAMIAGKANFHPDDWESVSKSGYDFVSWAMTTEPAHRASVKELLNHPFITQKRYGAMQHAVHSSRALLCNDQQIRPLFNSRKSVRPTEH